jgi:hypothetical protein
MTFSELMGALVQTASQGVVAGSRRNALSALEARYRATRESRDVLLALTAAVTPAPSPTTRTARRSA